MNSLHQHAANLARHLFERNLIDGKLSAPYSEQYYELISPFLGVALGKAPQSNQTDVDSAVESAQSAFSNWKKIPAKKRGQMVYACAALLEKHADELAQILSLETGKALRTESIPEIAATADLYRFYGGLASELKGETLPFDPNILAITTREPLGVVAAIIPWNVPLLLMALKVAPALVAGNTVVLKSAEEAPLAVLRVVELFSQILPAGVLNLISGDGENTGAALIKHPRVKKISFTGSVETGKIVYGSAAQRLVPVTLELGGKSPMIVCEDADLETTIQGAFVGMRFTRQGQSCSAASRIFVHQNLYQAFIDGLETRLNALLIGDPLDPQTEVGTIISKQQCDKIQGFIRLAESTPGVEIRRCAKIPIQTGSQKGLFLQPMLLENVPFESDLVRKEIFGPISCIFKFSNLDEAISLANQSNFGLAASIWTRNLSSALRATQELEAGFVQVNQNLVVQAGLSYGGFKDSGIGKEASLEAMLEHYTRKKTVLVNLA